MKSVYEDQSSKVIKYLQNNQDESQLQKPVYVSLPPRFKRYKPKLNLADDFTKQVLVEPVIEFDFEPQKRYNILERKKVENAKTTEVFVTQIQLDAQSRINLNSEYQRTKKQINMNKQILLRLGLLSTQAKRQFEIDKLQYRALKMRKDQEQIPVFDKNQLEIVTKQISIQEKRNLRTATTRLATSASAAGKTALEFQEYYFNQVLSQRPAYLSTTSARSNRPQTQRAKNRIKNFYNSLATVQIENYQSIQTETQTVEKMINRIKTDLRQSEERLQDYNDEINQALTQEIMEQVIKYKNSK
ncbi:hypothetical protein pb186bvf_013376 [Paramecium bursaria]